MELDQARERARAKLREIEDPATPLALNEEYPPTEIDWAWLFPFNSARYLQTGDLSDLVPSGPLVVNKAGDDVWIANSAPPVEQWLNQYAESHGLPPVPMPKPFSF